MTISYSTKNKIALGAVCLAALMFGLEISSVPVILPTLEKVLHGNLRSMQWIMNSYTIACTTVLMAAGTLADRYGRKRIFVISLALFGVTSLICGLAQNTAVLILSRFLQGMGGGAMLICLLAILSHQFQEGQERSKAFGAWGIIFGIGLGFGPIIGGAIVALSDWKWVFLVHIFLTLVTLILVFIGVKESKDPGAKKLDIAGIVSLSLSVFGLTYFITEGSDLPLGWITIILCVTAISFAVFLVAEKSNRHPMFDFSVFKVRNFSGAIMGSIGMNFSFWPFMIYLPIYFQGALGYGPIAAGLSLLAYTLPTLVVPPFAERLTLRHGPRRIIPVGMFMIGSGLLLMRYGSTVFRASWLTVLPGAVLAGIGLGLTNTPVSNTTTASVSSDRAGMASGIDMSARLVTLAINIALMGFLLSKGVLLHLNGALAGKLSDSRLSSLAERIATGDFVTVHTDFPELAGFDSSGAIVRAALVHGLDTAMLYGGIGVWVLAGMSAIAFGRSHADSHNAGQETEAEICSEKA
jgi:EmrB/QacA subfamily drug resistance transporter